MMRSEERGARSEFLRAVGSRRGADSAPTIAQSEIRRFCRRAVTLVELLITITIISILAGLILGVASVAGEKARENQTRHIVQRMHQLLMEHYDSYRNRRVRLNPLVASEINQEIPPNPPGRRGQALAQARLLALREMMVMEVPDRWSDIILERVDQHTTGDPAVQPVYLNARTDLSNVYYRRFQQAYSRIGQTSPTTNQVIDEQTILDNQGAECLYIVITLATGDGEARGLFAENSIGDTDGDGAPEFLDGWGNPIEFLRWAPGFDSLIQLNANTLADMDDVDVRAEIAKDHDPLDLFRQDSVAYRLVPLIYSPGPDEEGGLYIEPEYVTWRKNIQFKVNTTSPFVVPILTPYQINPSDLSAYLGTALSEIDPDEDSTSTDNIHNHLLGLRGRP